VRQPGGASYCPLGQGIQKFLNRMPQVLPGEKINDQCRNEQRGDQDEKEKEDQVVVVIEFSNPLGSGEEGMVCRCCCCFSLGVIRCLETGEEK